MSENISDVELHEAHRARYLNYALSVITSRALPDVRDGMKPVQRRILYAMFRNLRLTPEAKHRKSAAVIGEVMAKYHPHGDQSIYDAMVRMAQEFSLRYALVDGQGNFGSLDGDRAAAMRYTETRLRHIAIEYLSELGKQTVDYRQNYDGTQFEPTVLPAQVPGLLINGATGIAVGMATNIPPHNLREVIRALIALIDNPDMPAEKLLGRYIKGPDFPTGGTILNTREEITEIYATGRGALDVRGEYELEKEGRTTQIVVTSIPYAVNKANLIADIADHIRKNKIPQILDVRDESTEQIRIILELKRGANPEAAMAYIYKRTSLQNRFNVNLTALCPTQDPQVCQPRQLSLRAMLIYFLDFRMDVTSRRLSFDLEQLEKRIHILKAFEIIFSALDEAIALIRASSGKADAREKLMERFELDWEQAEAILETKLYRLAKLEIDSIREELEAKEAAAAEIREVLGSDEKLWSLIRSELDALREAYGDKRRTKIVGPQSEESFSEEVYITKEDAFVMVTRDGWFKRQKSYTDLSAVRVREGDEVGWVVPASTREALVVFTDRGKAYTLRVADITATTGYGEPLQTRFDFADGEHVIGAITTDKRILPAPDSVDVVVEEEGEAVEAPSPGPYITAVTRGGKTARLSLSLFQTPSTVNGRFFIRLDKKFPKDQVVLARISSSDDLVSLATRKGRCLLFRAAEAKVLSGAGKGVMAIKLKKGDWVVGATLVRERMEGLQIETNRGRAEVVRSNKFSVSRRGAKGREIIKMGHISKVHIPAYELAFPPVEGEESDLHLTAPAEVSADLNGAEEFPSPSSGRSDTVPQMPAFDVSEEPTGDLVDEDDENQGDLF